MAADTSGLIITADNTDATAAEIRAAIAKGLETCGLVAEGYAKALCPVDSGRLRNSITHVTDREAAYIGTNVGYAPYVELGTTRQAAQPFLRPAAADHMDQYRSILRDALGNA